MDITIACDIMMNMEGSIRPAIYLAKELVRRGHNVTVMSPFLSKDVQEHLRAGKIRPLNLSGKFATKSLGSSILWFEAWAREAFLRLNSRHISELPVTINFSQMVSVPSAAWYLQGPTSIALRDMEGELSTRFRIAYNLVRSMIDHADERLVSDMGRCSSLIIANSAFCASMYSKFGVKAHEVIYPPVDCGIFQPSTRNPKSDYVLTYFGKETKFSVLRNIADKGVKMKAFGSKIPLFISPLQRDLTRHPNIEYKGRVSMEELVELYSNAAFTLFPFNHEPFGYVLLESMACGTPVLTCDIQGPAEYVVDEQTGWLAQSDREMVTKAVQLWDEGYEQAMRRNCTEAASKLDKGVYLGRWMKALNGI